MTDQFESSRLKIKRAYRHIQELESEFKAFLQTDFCTLHADTDPQTGQASVYVQSSGSAPPEMSLIIGDALHNLRTALDHAMVQILGEGGSRESFPVAKERDNPGAHSTYGLIRKTLPKLADLLTEKIDIYDTGNPCIWAISKLDNIDKHNLLITTTSVQGISGFSLANKQRNITMSKLTAVVGQGGRVNIASLPGPLEITDKGQVAAHILFAKGQPLQGKPIVDSLKKMAELSLQAIETLELFWFGKGEEGKPVEGA